MPGSIKEDKPKKHILVAKLIVILVYSVVVFLLITRASLSQVPQKAGELVLWLIISIVIALVIFYKGWDIDKWFEKF